MATSWKDWLVWKWWALCSWMVEYPNISCTIQWHCRCRCQCQAITVIALIYLSCVQIPDVIHERWPVSLVSLMMVLTSNIHVLSGSLLHSKVVYRHSAVDYGVLGSPRWWWGVVVDTLGPWWLPPISYAIRCCHTGYSEGAWSLWSIVLIGDDGCILQESHSTEDRTLGCMIIHLVHCCPSPWFIELLIYRLSSKNWSSEAWGFQFLLIGNC